MSASKIVSALVCLFSFLSSAAVAQEARIGHSGLPVPRFVNLKYDKTNGRMGPSRNEYQVRYIYQRRHLPVKVVAETRDDVWRQVEDPDGIRSWVHRSQLVSADVAMILTEQGTLLRKSPAYDARVRAKLQKGVLVRLDECEQGWCRVKAGKLKGWIQKDTLWGVNHSHQG